MYPNRDVLNGGALAPTVRTGLELAGGAVSSYAANNAYAATGSAISLFQTLRYHSYDPTMDSFGYNGPSR